MDIPYVLALIAGIPYIGPYAVAIPYLIALGALVAMFIDPPKADSSQFYRTFYALIQWCALNKLKAVNLLSKAAPEGSAPTAAVPDSKAIPVSVIGDPK